jgi:DNA polymerase
MDPGQREHIVALLDFYVAAGIDIALDEEPHDRFAETAAAGPAPSAEPSSVREARRPEPVLSAPSLAPSVPASQGTEALVADVRARAAEASTLDELRAMLETFDGCSLKASARQLVFADGAAGSRVMLLGEAPGAEEDRSGRPFVGRAGQLLDRMLGAIGLDRTGVYIANIVPWRPPGNRTPTPQEVAVCLPFTLRQIELARPEVLVTLGAPSTQTILGVKDGITRLRGRWHEHRLGERTLRVLPMLHPAYLLRQPLHKRFAWRDLRLLRAELDGSGRGGQL